MDTRVVDHPRPLPAEARREDISDPGRLALMGAAYIALYLVLDRLSFLHEFRELGISLWSPATGLSMALLLTKGFVFSPLFFLASCLADLYVHALPRSIASITVTAAIGTAGYSGLVWVLQRLLNFDLRCVGLRNIVVLLVAIPVGIIAIAVAYCAALFVMGHLPADLFWSAVGHFWIGDTVGTVTVVPVIMAGFVAVNQRPAMRADFPKIVDFAVFAIGLAGAFWVIFSPRNANELQFFYLLFLPVVWIAIRAGFVGAALGISLLHLVFVVITTLEGYRAADFMAFQMLILALSAAGLLLGAMVLERHQTGERIREQQAELSRMSRFMTAGTMGLSVAHQISQPLSSVGAYLHAARRLMGTVHCDPAVADALDKAEAEARRAREVLERIRDFLSFGTVEPGPVDLITMVSKIAGLSRADALSRGVRIVVDDLRPPSVMADPVHVEQVLLNLVANAVDAAAERSDAKGIVTIRVAPCEGGARVCVEDNGPGIAPEIAGRLLEPFETTKPTGMGLGLALSRQIVESHGGHLTWVKLNPKGTRFMFDLRIDGPVPHAP